MITALRTTPEGVARVQQAEKRQNQHIAKGIEEMRKKELSSSSVAGEDGTLQSNDREDRLDHSAWEGGAEGAQLKHEDEVEMDIEKEDDAVHDMFAGCADLKQAKTSGSHKPSADSEADDEYE